MLNLPKKTILYFGIINSLLFGIEIPENYKCEYNQKIIDENNKTIQYKGLLYYKNKKNIKWKYIEPVYKDIIIKGNKIFIIEPDLEQVIIRKNDPFLKKNIFSLLKDIKKDMIKDNKYTNNINDIKYNIYFNKKYIPIKIEYIDTMGNKVEINFFNPKYNIDIENEFKFLIPNNYDIITN